MTLTESQVRELLMAAVQSRCASPNGKFWADESLQVGCLDEMVKDLCCDGVMTIADREKILMTLADAMRKIESRYEVSK